jgi:diguanylate cyclase (GGDEF)-like protein/PAS domain S-box-containing protein
VSGDDGRETTAAIETSLDELYEQAPCGYLSTTTGGVIVRVNGTLLDWTGYRRDELIGVPFVSLLRTGSQLLYETRYLPVLLLNRDAREVALEMRRADGGTMPILVNGSVVRDAGGAPSAMRLAVFDSTVRQGYERELLNARRLAESSEAHVRSLQNASSGFGSAATDVALADEIAKSAREAFSAGGAAVFLLGAEGLLEHSSRSAAEGSTPPIDVELAEIAMRTLRTVVVGRASAAVTRRPVLTERLRAARAETLCVVPLVEDGRPLGVVVCAFGRARTFDARDSELQEALARQAGQALTRIRLQGQLEHLALYDQLTGLARRPVVRERLVDAMKSAELTKTSMAFMFIDLDGFKAINDGLGHAVGDSVLTEIGGRLASVVRHGDVVGRFGGDEFVVICEQADASAVERVSERLHAAIRQPLSGVANGAVVTGSIGIAIYSGSIAMAPEVLFESADAAMYRSKHAGKNRTTMVDVETEEADGATAAAVP